MTSVKLEKLKKMLKERQLKLSNLRADNSKQAIGDYSSVTLFQTALSSD